MATKIQSRYRGVLGRRKAAQRWQERDTEKADVMIALHWGMVGRRIARERRTAMWYHSASMIQRNYRGRLGKKIFAIHKERVRKKKAAFLQRAWRGYRGRYKAWRFRKYLDDGAKRMNEVVRLHERGKLWESIFDKDGDGEEDEKPPLDEMLDAALTLMCNSGDYANAQLYVRDAVRFYPEAVEALTAYAILLHMVWDSYGFLKVPRPDILEEGIEIVMKCHELDPSRTAFNKYEVMYFQNSRRMRPFDPRRLANQGICLHVVYGTFDSKTLDKKTLATYWETNRRAENLFQRAIDMDSGCNHPAIRSMAKVFRSLYKTKRELLLTKPKSFPIGERGSKVMFNVSIYKCADPESTEIDRREKIVCTAVEREWKGGVLSGVKAAEEKFEEERKAAAEKTPEGTRRMSKVLQKATNKAIISKNLKVVTLENAFSIKNTRKVAAASSSKNEDKGELQKYRAHLRMLNLKVNPVARDFVVHEQEWRALMKVSFEMECKSGRPMKIIEEEFRLNPMKIVANYILTRLCVRSTYDTIENERQRVLILPQIQGIRDKAVTEMMQDYASRRLQRVFRGFQGRAQMKRMIFRFKEKEAQEKITQKKRKAMADRRQYRAWCACVVQARIKGLLWRRRLNKMQGAAVTVQTAFRGFSVRQKAKEAQRKKLEGAQVLTVYKRGRVVSGVHLFLTVRRCGLSFKLIGRSEEHMDTFLGYVYREDTLALVEAHNQKVTNWKAEQAAEADRKFAIMYEGYDQSKESDEVKKIHMLQEFMKDPAKAAEKVEAIEKTVVKHWQYDKVLQVVLLNVALVDPIRACSWDMAKQEGRKVLICNPVLGRDAKGHGILKFNGQKRILKDMRKAIGRYEKGLKKRQRQQEALGKPLDLY
jgi:hypothetical protein